MTPKRNAKQRDRQRKRDKGRQKERDRGREIVTALAQMPWTTLCVAAALNQVLTSYNNNFTIAF